MLKAPIRLYSYLLVAAVTASRPSNNTAMSERHGSVQERVEGCMVWDSLAENRSECRACVAAEAQKGI